MPTTLTPAAIKELEQLLWNSRRSLSEVYREWRTGASIEEMAIARNHADLKQIKDTMSALRVLFGREQLPNRGKGRQQAIYEAQFWLNSDLYLSAELIEHFEKILVRAEKTNTRRHDRYEPPIVPKRSVYTQAREVQKLEGDVSGIYVISKKSFVELHEALGRPLLVKIGWSTNVWDRITNAQTWDPDPIEVMRVYPCENPNFIEGKIHIVLDTLGCREDSGGGKEWFNVSMELIDSIAKTLNLEDVANET